MLASHRILENLGSESISDIDSHFVENNCLSDTMTEYFSPLNITHISGQPHCLPDEVVDKLPRFTRTDAINASLHLKNLSRCISAYINDPAYRHEDVYMKLFSLSLDRDAGDWFNNLPDNSFATLVTFKIAFTNKFGEKKEPRHQLAALTTIKRGENETMDEFDKKFTDLTKAIHTDYKPTAQSILFYYIEALSGEM